MMQTVLNKGRRKLGLEVNRLRHARFDEKLYFLHLPKCGGSSLHDALKNVARPSLQLDPVASRDAAKASGQTLDAYREELLLYFMAMRDLRYIGGHFSWSDRAYGAYGQDWHFITVLRHPVDKWLSQYFYNRYKESTHFKLEASLEDYLASEAGRALGRNMVSKLADPSAQESEALQQAKANLDKFALIGVLEHMDRFYRDFNARFGVALYALHTRKNPAAERQQAAKRDPEIRRSVEAVCQPDLELYHRALDRLGLA